MKNLSILFALIFALLLITPINGQELPEQCKLGLANSPNIREIKLGMSPTQVEKILKTKIILKDYKVNFTDEILIGTKEYYFSGITSDTKPTQLENIDALYLYFYNDFLFRVFVTYAKPKVSWKDIKEFVLFLSDKFDLPKNSWDFNSETSFSDHLYLRGSLFCDGFYLSAKIDEYERPMIHLTDNKVYDLVAAKEKQLTKKYKLKKMKEKQLVEKNESKKRSSEIEKEKGFKP